MLDNKGYEKVNDKQKIRLLLIVLGIAVVGFLIELKCYDWIYDYLKYLD